jgi:hypothetical protein
LVALGQIELTLEGGFHACRLWCGLSLVLFWFCASNTSF